MNCSAPHVYDLSLFCTNQSKSDEESKICFPDDIRSYSVLAGIWCVINAVVGFSGNLLTLLAIPFAARRKK